VEIFLLLSEKIQKIYDKMLNGERILMIEIAPLIEEAKNLENEKGIKGSEVNISESYLPYL
jgi:hypothetical protein